MATTTGPAVVFGPSSVVIIPDGQNSFNDASDANQYELLGSSGLITLGDAYFDGVITGFQAGDGILTQDLPAWDAITYDPTTEALDFFGGGAVVGELTIAQSVVGQYSTSSFDVSSEGGGFASVSTSTPAVATAVSVQTNFAQATVTAGPGEEQVTAPNIDMRTLLGQSLQFIDGTLAFDRATFEPTGSQLPMLYRIYETAFGRAPDAVGENYWNGLLNQSLTPIELADQFLGSSEYQADVGTVDNDVFVDQLYERGLGRVPDGPGFSFWTGLLNAGADRGAILLDIAQSPETMARDQQIASAGVFTPNA